LTAEQQAGIDALKAKPWGSGVPNLAYNIGGGVTDASARVGLPPEVSGGLGYGANVLTQAIPALLGSGFAEVKAAPLMKDAGRSLMQSAVKPSLQDLRSGDAAKGIETMLKQGYNPTEGGVQAMQGKIDALGNEISGAIANSNAMINKNAVASRLNDALAKFRTQVNPQADLATIEDAWSKFLAHPDLAGKTTMPVQLAQSMKQGTYRALGDKPYGELSGAATEAQKQLARGLKEEISAAVPQVSGINQLQGELLNAKSIAERRALMSGNRNPLSLGLLAPTDMKTIGFLADKSDILKAYLARMLYSGSSAIPQALGGAAGGALMMPSGQAPEQGVLYR
jgi:hypothetical protein